MAHPAGGLARIHQVRLGAERSQACVTQRVNPGKRKNMLRKIPVLRIVAQKGAAEMFRAARVMLGREDCMKRGNILRQPPNQLRR